MRNLLDRSVRTSFITLTQVGKAKQLMISSHTHTHKKKKRTTQDRRKHEKKTQGGGGEGRKSVSLLLKTERSSYARATSSSEDTYISAALENRGKNDDEPDMLSFA